MLRELTVDEAGVLLAEAVQVLGTLEGMDIIDRPETEPLPRGVLTCGEAVRLIPAIVVLVTQMYPELLEPNALEEALRIATVRGAGSIIN